MIFAGGSAPVQQQIGGLHRHITMDQAMKTMPI
jgi:hypothetical protein